LEIQARSIIKLGTLLGLNSAEFKVIRGSYIIKATEGLIVLLVLETDDVT